MCSPPIWSTTPCSVRSTACAMSAAWRWTSCPQTGRGASTTTTLNACSGPRPRAIVCTHASNLTGDAVDICPRGRARARARTCCLWWTPHRRAGVLPIDMERMHIDVLCFTGHKSPHGAAGNGRAVPARRPGHPAVEGRRDGRADLLRAPAASSCPRGSRRERSTATASRDWTRRWTSSR